VKNPDDTSRGREHLACAWTAITCASYINPDVVPRVAKEEARRRAKEREKSFRSVRDRDVLGFLIDHAPLERWEREFSRIVRREAYYFAPQMQTKIMNEGWATYWHSKNHDGEGLRLVGDHRLRRAQRAGVLATSAREDINPYKLGVELFRHIEDRWNRGQFGKEWDRLRRRSHERRNWDRRTGLGREKIFEVRKHYTDVTFHRRVLSRRTSSSNKRCTAFGYNSRNDRYEIESRKFNEVKRSYSFASPTRGQPFIYVRRRQPRQSRRAIATRTNTKGIDLKLDYAARGARNHSCASGSARSRSTPSSKRSPRFYVLMERNTSSAPADRKRRSGD
jgi:stage V sporulation protein R